MQASFHISLQDIAAYTDDLLAALGDEKFRCGIIRFQLRYLDDQKCLELLGAIGDKLLDMDGYVLLQEAVYDN